MALPTAAIWSSIAKDLTKFKTQIRAELDRQRTGINEARRLNGLPGMSADLTRTTQYLTYSNLDLEPFVIVGPDEEDFGEYLSIPPVDPYANAEENKSSKWVLSL